MKKSISLLLSVMIFSSIFMFNVYAVDENTYGMNISVSKSTKTVDGVVYTARPYTIRAEYDNGAGADSDLFTKKTWMRVDLLDENADLLEVYRANKEKENNVQDGASYYGNTLRTIFELDVTLNGTYLFCGWDGDTEGAPRFIERVDITDIELERPMGWLEVYTTGDYSGETIAYMLVKNIESGKDSQIKRFALCKDYDLPPGSWPESLPPQYCNEYFDEQMKSLYDGFLNGGLYLGDTFTNTGSEIVPQDNRYAIRDGGGYILFIEDTNGRYSHLNVSVNPKLFSESAPEIITEVVEEDEYKATVKVDVRSEYDIARLDYAVLTPHDMVSSENGTDEYFLEKKKVKIENNLIELTGTAVICAMDTYGNASYKRVEIEDKKESESQETESIFQNGSGTAEDPFIVTTARELDAVRGDLSAHYKLGNDIDLTEYLGEGGEGYAKWGDAGWEPIGQSSESGYEYFSGSFDGAYHVISGLWINRADTDNIGLFGGVESYDDGARVQNLGIEIAESGVTGGRNVGGLAGYLSGEIGNCSVVGGRVSGVESVGGLIGGQIVTGTTVGCFAKVDVISESDGDIAGNIGGLIGRASGAARYCYAEGAVRGSRNCGGLIGNLGGMASVVNCYASGDVVSSGDCAGGLVGYVSDGDISYSSSSGKTQGGSYVGGLVGQQAGLSGISGCYSSSAVVAAGDYAGGLVGAQITPPYFQNYNRIANCYAGGSVETQGEHFGAVSGYKDEESSILDCYRSDAFTINGNKISSEDENSTPDMLNGGETTEVKLSQAPIVNITLSETEKTEKPVTVRLNIKTNNDIESVTYVEDVQGGDASAAAATGDIASARRDVDIELLLSDPEQYAELVGGYESAAIISDYYINAGYPDGGAQVVENGSLDIEENGSYIICVEDKEGNKTFTYINIDNIEPQTEEPIDYPYEIKSLSALSTSGDKLETPPLNTDFMAEVAVYKNEARDTEDYVFVAVYDKNGMLLNIDYVRSNFAPNYDYSIGFNIPAQNREIGSIKAFVWSGFDNAEPLAEAKAVEFGA